MMFKTIKQLCDESPEFREEIVTVVTRGVEPQDVDCSSERIRESIERNLTKSEKAARQRDLANQFLTGKI